jgi:hypothetical protein
VKLYTGLDLHSSNTYLGIIDETGKKEYKQKLPNDRERILAAHHADHAPQGATLWIRW